ncbi:hypothetical protein ACFE04_029483 [Oxalis oulophora]
MEHVNEEQTIQIPRKTLEDLTKVLSQFQPKNNICFDKTSIFTTSLDDFVHVNSILLISVFLAFLFPASTNGRHGLEPPGCKADETTKKMLILCEVASFVFFLLSILSAKAFKIQLNFSRHSVVKNNYDTDFRRGGMMILCATASCVGIVFLMVSITSRVEVVIGKIHCGSEYSFNVVVLIYVVVVATLIIYLFPMVRAIRESIKLLEEK